MSDEPDYRTIVTAVIYDEAGRITGHKTQAIGFTEQEIAAGARMLVVASALDDEETRLRNYVRVNLKTPKIAERPVLASVPSDARVPVGTEISIPKVPACTVRFEGPVSGTHEHPGGTLKIGFTLSGTYRISFEAFPNLPCSFDMTVTP